MYIVLHSKLPCSIKVVNDDACVDVLSEHQVLDSKPVDTRQPNLAMS